MAYTLENNLYIQDNLFKNFIQVTTNEEGIVAGVGYARQEFGITKGTFWSEDGNKLAFYQKDERNVTTYPLVEYDSMQLRFVTLNIQWLVVRVKFHQLEL